MVTPPEKIIFLVTLQYVQLRYFAWREAKAAELEAKGAQADRLAKQLDCNLCRLGVCGLGGAQLSCLLVRGSLRLVARAALLTLLPRLRVALLTLLARELEAVYHLPLALLGGLPGRPP